MLIFTGCLYSDASGGRRCGLRADPAQSVLLADHSKNLKFSLVSSILLQIGTKGRMSGKILCCARSFGLNEPYYTIASAFLTRNLENSFPAIFTYSITAVLPTPSPASVFRHNDLFLNPLF